MKKIIIAIFALFFGMNVSAQSDGFFTYTNVDKRTETMGNLPALPSSHGLDGNADAPLGSGVLLLAAFALLKLKIDN